jgi:hypothetical protein
MYNDFINIDIIISLILGCKVTTLFRKLYQLPMENLRIRKNTKRLQINELWKKTDHTLWKMPIIGEMISSKK